MCWCVNTHSQAIGCCYRRRTVCFNFLHSFYLPLSPPLALAKGFQIVRDESIKVLTQNYVIMNRILSPSISYNAAAWC
jgi:hypothetical protein